MKIKVAINIVMFMLWSNLLAKAQNLENYLLDAAENNPGLMARYYEFEAALQKTTQIKALPNLSLSVGYFISPVETRVGPQQVRFSLVQMFPWFGTNAAKANATDLVAQSMFYQFQDKKMSFSSK